MFSIKEKIDAIFKNILGSAPLKIIHLKRGVMTFKYKVIYKHRSYIIRFYPRNRKNIVNYEPDVIQKSYSLGAKVPKLISDSRSNIKYDMEYIIYEYIDGVPLNFLLYQLDSKRLKKIGREIFDNIDIISCVPVQGYGDLVTNGYAKYLSWHDFMNDVINQSKISYIPFVNENVKEKLKNLIHKYKNRLQHVQSCIVYYDLSPQNIIVSKDSELMSIIDLEGLLSGDMLLSLGFCFAKNEENDFFYSLYNAYLCKDNYLDLRLLHIYSVLRIFRLSRYVDQPLPTGCQREDIQRMFPGFVKSLTYLNLI